MATDGAGHAPRVLELRCTWGFRGTQSARGRERIRLVLDADLVEQDRVGGAIRQEALCRGRTVWQRRRDDDDFAAKALRWIDGGFPGEWEGDVKHLPGGTRYEWGALLADRLVEGVGEALLEDLLGDTGASRRADTHVRLVFRALEPRAARLPVEALVWPRRTKKPLVAQDASVSILRTATELAGGVATRSSLAGREPGRYRVLVLHAPGASQDFRPGELGKELLAPAGYDGIARVAVPDEPTEIDALTGSLGERARRSDLVILTGHGAGPSGLVVRDDTLDGDAIGQALADGPGVVVLAMCGSGLDSAPDDVVQRASVAERAARCGIPLTIGFHATETNFGAMRDFVGAIAKAIAHPLRAGPPSLLEWERAVRSAQSVAVEMVAAITYVHPSLLAGGQPLRAQARRRVVIAGSATAVPWYVPGQMVLFARPGTDAVELLRVPLPVDTGVELHVTVVADGPHDLGRSALKPLDLERMAAGWGLAADAGIQIRSSGNRPPSGWANRSGELSAVVRALSFITGDHPSADVLALIDDAVADDWGTHDCAPRVVAVSTGRRVTRFDTWPALSVSAGPPVPPGVVAALPDKPPFVADAWQDLARCFDMATVLGLVAQQGARAYEAASLPPALHDAVSRETLAVVIPAAATIAARGGTYGVGLRHARERACDAHDELS